MSNLRRGMMAAAGAAGGVIEYQLWSWGQTDYGAAMQGDAVQRCSPVQVGDTFIGELDLATDGMNAIQNRIASGSYSSAVVKGDGTLWTCGQNSYGTLGVGDLTNRSSPVQVGSLTDWRSVTISNDVMLATKTDGTLWSWGYRYTNFAAGAGSGAANVSSPVQVGTDTDWSYVIQSNGSGVAASGLKTDGELWQWGTSDGHWQQGSETYTTYTPTQIGDKYYDYVGSCGDVSYGIEKDTGKLWAWGLGSNGVLGQGDTTSQSSPVQIGVATDWAWANGGRIKQMMFSNTAGELWGLGHNGDGSFGLTNTVQYSSPVQLGGPGGWASGGHGNYDTGCHGITDTNGDNTGGALWWIGGQFGDGAPGTGESDGGSSPIQVGTDTDWLCLNPQGIDKSAVKLAIKKA